MKKLLTLAFLCLSSYSVLAVDMELIAPDGTQSKLSDYRGKWVVANYWATWCPPCKAEMPELQAFHDEHSEKDGVVIGLNTEVINEESINTFLEDYFITYPNFIVGPVSKTELGPIPGLPTTFLISPEGNIEAKQVGAITSEMIEKFIEKWEAKQKSLVAK